MRSIRLLGLLLALVAAPSAAQDNVEAAWAALAHDGVALIRHGEAPGPAGDPPGFRLDDCATQRNLSDAGRAQAAALGETIRRHAIAIGRVFSSQWCRTRETAALLALGPVEPLPVLDNLFGRRDAAADQTRAVRAVIAAWRGPGALVMVTHGVNILPFAGFNPAEAELVVVEPRPESGDGLRVVGRIPPPR